MHYRIRGNNVQLVKTVVDKNTLKSKSSPIGSINLKTGVLSDEVLKSLSKDEVVEVRQWIQDQQTLSNLQQEVSARTLAEKISAATEWLKDADAAIAKQVVSDALFAMQNFKARAKNLGLKN